MISRKKKRTGIVEIIWKEDEILFETGEAIS